MPQGITTARAAGAALATLAALLIGGSGAASAAAIGQTSASQDSVSWSSADRSTLAAVGRDQPCPQGWVCLYEHPNFNRDQDGRMLRFQENRWQRLGEFGFNDKTSSWKNRLGRDACLAKHWPVTNDRLHLEEGASSAGMGGWNDEASGVKPGSC